ncbi:MAG: SDR family oxidoreductase [Candidatus Andersenbacteria bacterium]
MTPKKIILAGTKPHSIARVIGRHLHEQGWDVWLYSRHAKRVEHTRWHERRCDVTKSADIARLLSEVGTPQAVVFSADSDGHGTIQRISERRLRALIDAKVTGSILLTKRVLAHSRKPVSLVWLIGKIGVKPQDLFLYGVVNAAVVAFVDQLKALGRTVRPYMLPLGVITPSTLGDAYLRQNPGKQLATDSPVNVARFVARILRGGVRIRYRTKGSI